MNKINLTRIIFMGFLILSVLNLSSAQVKPIDDRQRQYLQDQINNVNRYQENYKKTKEQEQKARENDMPDIAERYAKNANGWAQLISDTCNDIIKKVDEYYNIPKPANTTIEYDPNCKGKFGSTSGTKTNVKIKICPSDFSDGPDLIASTKIHEYNHAQQILRCDSSNADFWKYCTFLFHLTELEAYLASEKAHDEGLITLPPEHKQRIRDAIRSHALSCVRKILEPFAIWIPQDKLNAKPATEVLATALIANPLELPQVVNIEIVDKLGWPIIVPYTNPVAIPPDGEAGFGITIMVPPGTPPLTVNEVTLKVNTEIQDVFLISVSPSVEITAGPEITASRGDMVSADFQIRNTGTVPDMFHIEISNPLLWTTGAVPPSMMLNAGQTANISVPLTIPDVLTTFTTNMIYCTATANMDSSQTATAWVPVKIKEYDFSMIGFSAPDKVIDAGHISTPKTKVTNSGYVESFFDVFFEVTNSEGDVVFSEAVNAPSLAPGAIEEISFSPLTLATPGIYTFSAWTNHPNDADSINDFISEDIEVKIVTAVRDWDAFTK